MPRRTLKRSSKAKNKTRSRKQRGGIGYVFGYTKTENDKNFAQFYKYLGLGFKGNEDADHKIVKETLEKLKRNWVKYDINNDTELRRKLMINKYNITKGMVAILIKYGLDVNKPDNNGRTFLYDALEYGYEALTIAKYLIDRTGTNLHVATKKGTYLHALARHDNSVNDDGSENREIGEVIDILVKAEIDIDERDEKGKKYTEIIAEKVEEIRKQAEWYKKMTKTSYGHDVFDVSLKTPKRTSRSPKRTSRSPKRTSPSTKRTSPSPSRSR